MSHLLNKILLLEKKISVQKDAIHVLLFSENTNCYPEVFLRHSLILYKTLEGLSPSVLTWIRPDEQYRGIFCFFFVISLR